MMCHDHEITEGTNYVSVSRIELEPEGVEALLVGHPHMHNCPQPCESFRQVNVVLVD
jgi:hypothetical protein